MRSAVSTSAFRQAARPRRLPTQYSRFASSNAESAQKKTQDALGSAQKTAEKLWESSKKFLGPLGERAGSMLGCMSSREHLPIADTDAALFVFSIPSTCDVQLVRCTRIVEAGLRGGALATSHRPCSGEKCIFDVMEPC